ncbi:MAG: 2,3-bisphosphoglycerate-independent phosphoglycerate mutase [Patescibacteria group bacterium]|nr:2,3-bisphosphoglycerate-independent phosphoglycerate mutase [Patescibacteria group bacterium]
MGLKNKSERHSKGPVVVVVWDGFGVSKNKEGNATFYAKMPVWHKLWDEYPNSLLWADGINVGLPPGQPGNSEAGHATIGAGRAVETDQVAIDRAIRSRSFENNQALMQAAAHCLRNKSTLHMMGLLTDEKSGHASPHHVNSLIAFASTFDLKRVALHLFTDGRDTSPFRAASLIAELERKLPKNFTIASVMGRFYAMDRNKYWERTAMAYAALTSGLGVVAESATQAITHAYTRGESDEYITPTVICPNDYCEAPVTDGDAMIFWNLRSDRARQLTKPFVMPEFEKKERNAFKRKVKLKNLMYVTMTEFAKDLDSVISAFPHREVPGTLVEALRFNKQMYIAESEKFSQVTYFLNGGYDRPRFHEERIRIPSKRVARYDHSPRMRAAELATEVAKSIGKGYDLILVNFANADMVGHTGNLNAGIKACEALDDALGVIWKKVDQAKGTLIVTADHGNAERMESPFGGADTEHNMSPVPFLAAGEYVKSKDARRGALSDIAPTVLWLLGIDKPKEMTGHNLLR